MPESGADSHVQDSRPADLASGARIGHYTILRPLGRGGMGIVYVARDERLERDVALKTIGRAEDEELRARLWREARAAAAVSHPHICQVFDIDDTPHGIVLAMELLDGESLDARLHRGPLSPDECARMAGDVLAALGVLHERGLVHRDIKPSNVFLTAHGPKLLDFGLARRVFTPSSFDTVAEPGLTGAGVLIGTPQYMAPEQVRGSGVDNRTDLYAVGALLFHMLTGRPPFEAASIADALVAAIHEQPPALQGPPSVVAIDRIIRRAMQKDPEERYQTAGAMARALASVETASDSSRSASIPVRALTRLVFSPVRIARPDPEVSFLSMGLAEAVSGSLAALGNVVVRAPAVARAVTEDGTDPRHLAATADVDLVFSSTLLRSGASLRLTVQLIDVSSGTLLGAAPVTGTMDDIIAVEDAMVHSARHLLSQHRPDLVAAEGPARQSSVHHAPATARAFNLFLRGTEHARHLDQTEQARGLFEQAIAEDPGFAPAWAALGRCHRVYGKFFTDTARSLARAEEAFRHALALAPDLPAAHRYLTHLESEQGRATSAIGRLLQHATVNRNDALLFAGLVHACRYAGLLSASVAADAEARRLDPTVETGVDFTALHVAEGDEDLDRFLKTLPPGTAPHGGLIARAFSGSIERFRTGLAAVDTARLPPRYYMTVAAVSESTLAPHEAGPTVERALAAHSDPEAQFLCALCFFRMGDLERGLDVLEQTIASGYSPARMLARHPLFDSARDTARFVALVERLAARTHEAAEVFERSGGREMLGVNGELT